MIDDQNATADVSAKLTASVISGLTAPQLMTRRPLFRRWLVAAMLIAQVLCLYLTYSRGSMLGFAVGLGVLALAKYRRLIPIISSGRL